MLNDLDPDDLPPWPTASGRPMTYGEKCAIRVRLSMARRTLEQTLAQAMEATRPDEAAGDGAPPDLTSADA